MYCIFEKKRLGALLEIFVSSLFNFSAGKLSHNIRPLSFSLSFSLISLFISFSFPLIPLSFSLISFNFPFAFFYFPFISFTFPFRCFCFHLNSKKKCPTNVAVSLLNSLLKSQPGGLLEDHSTFEELGSELIFVSRVLLEIFVFSLFIFRPGIFFKDTVYRLQTVGCRANPCLMDLSESHNLFFSTEVEFD